MPPAHSSYKRPNSGNLSSTPARRRQCQAIAWLLEVTGMPISFSMPTTCSTSRRLVQEMNTASRSTEPATLMIALWIEAVGYAGGDVIVFLVKGAKDRYLVTAFGNVIAHEIVDVLAIGRQNADPLCAKGVESGKSGSERAGGIGPFLPDLDCRRATEGYHIKG